MRVVPISLLIMAFSTYCALAAADSDPPIAPISIEPVQQLTPPGGGVVSAIEVHGRRAFLGRPGSTAPVTPSPGVFIFRRSNHPGDVDAPWVFEQELARSSAFFGDRFGASIEYDGRTLMVGAPGRFPTLPGRVYVYEREGHEFLQRQELTIEEMEPNFGLRISLNGDQAAVTTVGFDYLTAAYVFRRGDDGVWVREARLAPQTQNVGEQFGYSVDLKGNRLIVGANEGAYAVIYRRKEQWVEEQRIVSQSNAGSFGVDVEIRQREAFVSAFSEDTIHRFVRKHGEWMQTDTFTLPFLPGPAGGPIGGPLQLRGPHDLFAGGSQGVYLLTSSASGWKLAAEFYMGANIALGDDSMDVSRDWLGAISGSNQVFLFDTSSLPD